MKRVPLKAFVSDFDGTLFDSTEANVQAYGRAFNAVGMLFDADRYRKNFGLRFPEMLRALAPHATDGQAAEIRRLKSLFYPEAFGLVRVNATLLRRLAKAHVSHKTALVTTANRPNVMNLLQHFSVDTALFDIIITGDEVTNSKPDPECYLTAARRLRVRPQECLVFEDSDIGIRAAISAGTRVVRVVI